MRSLADATPGTRSEQHGYQREAGRRDRDNERRSRTIESEAGGHPGIEREANVDARPEQP